MKEAGPVTTAGSWVAQDPPLTCTRGGSSRPARVDHKQRDAVRRPNGSNEWGEVKGRPPRPRSRVPTSTPPPRLCDGRGTPLSRRSTRGGRNAKLAPRATATGGGPGGKRVLMASAGGGDGEVSRGGEGVVRGGGGEQAAPTARTTPALVTQAPPVGGGGVRKRCVSYGASRQVGLTACLHPAAPQRGAAARELRHRPRR